jgi:5-methylcytosine-specific restriction protein A
MISIFKDGDASIWIPVAKGKNGAARAFLPINGLEGTYRYGYKAAPSTGGYFDALRDVQQSFIENEHKVFVVNSGRKEENNIEHAGGTATKQGLRFYSTVLYLESKSIG